MGLSFGLATIFSHIQLYAKITNTLGGISFSNEFAFFREAVYFGILILLGFIIYVNGYIGKMLEEIKEEGEVAREKYNRKILGKIVNSLIGRIKDDTI